MARRTGLLSFLLTCNNISMYLFFMIIVTIQYLIFLWICLNYFRLLSIMFSLLHQLVLHYYLLRFHCFISWCRNVISDVYVLTCLKIRVNMSSQFTTSPTVQNASEHRVFRVRNEIGPSLRDVYFVSSSHYVPDKCLGQISKKNKYSFDMYIL
jgi:hypothetical protein